MAITTEVFTPTKQAKLTFVERHVDELNENLVDALRTPGTQVVIYGHSGTGKSTLLFNVVNRLYEKTITTRCTADLTYDQLIINAFDSLNIYYQNATGDKKSSQITTNISSEYSLIKAAIGASFANERTTSMQRIVPPQLTAQRLAEFMGAANCCWIIEDFHKIKTDQKTKLSQQLKVFVDSSEAYPEVKTVLIGAVNTAREVIEYDSEMNNRVAELFVPLMTDTELHQILNKGEQLLNINFGQKIKNEIVRFSSGLASVTHRLALNMCQANNIDSTQTVLKNFNDNDFLKALKKYLSSSSDSMRKRYELATKVQKVRKFDNGKIILKAMANLDFNEIQQNTIFQEIKKEHPTYPQSNLSIYLSDLQKPEKGEIIIMNPNNGKYAFSDPLIRTSIKCLNDIENEGQLDPKVKERKIREALELLINDVFNKK